MLLVSVVASGEMLWMFATRPADERPMACAGLRRQSGDRGHQRRAAVLPGGRIGSRPLARLGWPMAAFIAAVLIGFVGDMRRYEQPGRTLARLSLAIFALAYVGLLLSFTMQLRILRGNLAGLTAVASLIAVVKMGDTGAYTVGRLIGRHKMTPPLAPAKHGRAWPARSCSRHWAGWFCDCCRGIGGPSPSRSGAGSPTASSSASPACWAIWPNR